MRKVGREPLLQAELLLLLRDRVVQENAAGEDQCQLEKRAH